jgi:hypothetical protein
LILASLSVEDGIRWIVRPSSRPNDSEGGQALVQTDAWPRPFTVRSQSVALRPPFSTAELSAAFGVQRIHEARGWIAISLPESSAATVPGLSREARYAGELLQRQLVAYVRRGALPETLFTFLECGGSHVDAAKQLNIHRITLAYRLKQIADSTQRDPAEPSARWPRLSSIQPIRPTAYLTVLVKGRPGFAGLSRAGSSAYPLLLKDDQ